MASTPYSELREALNELGEECSHGYGADWSKAVTKLLHLLTYAEQGRLLPKHPEDYVAKLVRERDEANVRFDDFQTRYLERMRIAVASAWHLGRSAQQVWGDHASEQRLTKDIEAAIDGAFK